MSNTNTGGPAFPLHNHGVQTLGMHISGMTLRDYFAANLQDEPDGNDYHNIVKSLLVGRECPNGSIDGWLAVAQFEADFRAAWRYMRADAMLKAREA